MEASKPFLPKGCLGTCLLGIGFLAILSALLIPEFNQPSRTPPVSPANVLANLAKECAVKLGVYPDGSNSFSEINLEGYRSITFAGSTTECSSSGEIIFESSDLKKYPTFKYNFSTGQRTCFHNGLTDQLLGCSSRKNGEW